MFDNIYNNLMSMRKADIVRQGAVWGVYSGTQSNLDYMAKHYTKNQLARHIADRLVWNANNLGFQFWNRDFL